MAILPNNVEHNQHVFVADAHTDPLLRSVTDLVLSEGSHSWMGMPEYSGGTLCLYWNASVTYREDPVLQAQELADALGTHLPRYSSESEERQTMIPMRNKAAQTITTRRPRV